MAIAEIERPPDVVITPKPRQVLVIAERDGVIGYCLSCRCRTPEGYVTQLTTGGAVRPPEMTDAQFRASKAESHEYFKRTYPEAEIVYSNPPDSASPENWACLESERMVA